MNDKIVIIGASGHGKVIADIAKLNNYKKIVFIDDDISKKKCGEYDVVGTRDIIKLLYRNDYDFFVAIGNNKIREDFIQKLDKLNITLVSLIHPTAVIDSSVKIALGTVIMANVVINAEVNIGRGCIINTSTTIDHESMIHDFVHISPGVHIAGNVNIEKNSWIGIGASVINNIFICEKCIIGAGAIVINDLKESGTYVGSPVRRVK